MLFLILFLPNKITWGGACASSHVLYLFVGQPRARFLSGAGQPQTKGNTAIPALRLKHRSGSCGTASALPKCSIMSGCGTRIVLRGQKPLALRTAAPASVRCFRHWRRSTLPQVRDYLRFWLGICRTSLAVSALRIMRYCPNGFGPFQFYCRRVSSPGLGLLLRCLQAG